MRSDKCCRSSNVIRRLLRTSERVLRAKTYELTTEQPIVMADTRLERFQVR